ncbi:MAG: type I-E CRISPR-associated endonuclease Cas1e [Sandaracinaceae bacterium]|nr:type I-E CRISPR-associated endonuclease Cas1e [Sandaracinaceae bacterium]
MLKGRLGLETARVPHADRHGVMWLARGNLVAESGTLHFLTAGSDGMPAGDYAIPFQMISCLVMQPGTTVSHDAVRLLTAHGTGLVFVGEGGVRFYAAMPFGPDASARARMQARAWADLEQRARIVRRMYAWRMGEIFPDADVEVLRGMEGVRAKQTYKVLAQQIGVRWYGRRFDRERPEKDDPPNQAINHASVAVVSAAQVAVAITGTLPQLGFIHEDSGLAFALDIADLFRDTVTVPCAFAAVKEALKRKDQPLGRIARRLVGRAIRRDGVVEKMIDRIKDLFDVGKVSTPAPQQDEPDEATEPSEGAEPA